MSVKEPDRDLAVNVARDDERVHGGSRRGRARGVRVHRRRTLRRQRAASPRPRRRDRAARAVRRVEAGRRGVRRHVEPTARRRQRRPPARQRVRPAAELRRRGRRGRDLLALPARTGSRRPCTATASRRATTSTSATSRGRSSSPESPGGPGRTTSAPAPETSVLELARLARALGRRLGEQRTFEPLRKGELRASALDAARIRDELGWEPEVGLDDGLAQTFAWYRDAALKAVLLAAGLGTRMRGAFGDVPKILAPFGTADAARPPARLPRRGGRRRGRGQPPPPRRRRSLEHLERGAPVPVRSRSRRSCSAPQARSLPLAGFLDEPFVLLYGDVVTDLDLGELRGDGARDARLLPERRARGQGCARGRRRAARDRRSSRRVEAGGEGLVNAGVHLLDPAILDHIPPAVRRFRPRRLAGGLAAGAAITAVPIDAYVKDVGTPEALAEAERDLGL